MARKYYYDTGEEKLGPVKGDDLLRLLREGEISPETWVRKAESKTWRQLANVDLREEEKKANKPMTLWRLLWQQLTPKTITGIIVVLIFVALMFTAAFFLLKLIWPFLLLLLLVWLVLRVLRSLA